MWLQFSVWMQFVCKMHASEKDRTKARGDAWQSLVSSVDKQGDLISISIASMLEWLCASLCLRACASNCVKKTDTAKKAEGV